MVIPVAVVAAAANADAKIVGVVVRVTVVNRRTEDAAFLCTMTLVPLMPLSLSLLRHFIFILVGESELNGAIKIVC